MYVKVVTIHKREDEEKWNHLSTDVYECNRVGILDVSDGRDYNICCIGDEEPFLLHVSNEKSKTKKIDLYIENEKGDTIGRY